MADRQPRPIVAAIVVAAAALVIAVAGVGVAFEYVSRPVDHRPPTTTHRTDPPRPIR